MLLHAPQGRLQQHLALHPPSHAVSRYNPQKMMSGGSPAHGLDPPAEPLQLSFRQRLLCHSHTPLNQQPHML